MYMQELQVLVCGQLLAYIVSNIILASTANYIVTKLKSCAGPCFEAKG
jgi:hypothetical protein